MDLRLGIILLCLLMGQVFTVSQKSDRDDEVENVPRAETLDRQLVERLDYRYSEHDSQTAVPDTEDHQLRIINQIQSMKMFAQGLADLMDFRVKSWNSTAKKLHTATRLVINTTHATATNETYIEAFFKIKLEDVLERVGMEFEDVDIVPEDLYQHQLDVEVDVFRQLAVRAIDGTTRRIINRRNALNSIFNQRK